MANPRNKQKNNLVMCKLDNLTSFESGVSRIEEATKDIVMDFITIKQHIKERVERTRESKLIRLDYMG